MRGEKSKPERYLHCFYNKLHLQIQFVKQNTLRSLADMGEVSVFFHDTHMILFYFFLVRGKLLYLICG